ncbi:ABC transporter ATP-binding protein [Hoeflea sp. TYP-13]|uniref:ABC transporter ATP-binding protein n=1 Tax=Hoeflea sp. TYP-13 TaxID=3230023 RepID=UPI0034C6CA30
MSALLEINDVFVRFTVRGGLLGAIGLANAGDIEAVSGVSLKIKAGETYGIVGESGSGKTTLARAVAGLHHASEGSINYNGMELRGLTESRFRPLRRDIVMMFQDPTGSLSPRLTVSSLITEPFRIQGMKGKDLDAEAGRLLSMVGLPREFGQRYPHQLSGGQARRVGVARALALDPKLLIADEPTAGLDVSVQGEMLNLLAALQDRMGLAIMIITHNLNVVRHITDRVGIMYLGKLVEEGPTEAIFSNPKHPYTLALLAANPEPDPDANLARIELNGEPPSVLNRPHGCEFHTRCPFVQPRCRTETPDWRDHGESRFHRCHFPEIWDAEQPVLEKVAQ